MSRSPQPYTPISGNPLPKNYSLTFYPLCPGSTTPTFTSLFTLLERNMKTLYKTSIMGWHPTQKRNEMLYEGLSYLLLHYTPAPRTPCDFSTTELAGFASFLKDEQDGMMVLYLYEIQIDERHQGKGLGGWLMGEVEGRARVLRDEGVGVEAVMLTVFAKNKGAREFYEKRGYYQHDHAPMKKTRRKEGEPDPEPSYYILAKKVDDNEVSRGNGEEEEEEEEEKVEKKQVEES